MVSLIFSHDVLSEPYKQTAVNKGFERFEAYLEARGERAFYVFGKIRECFADMPNFEDEYVIVQHTCDFTQEQKAEVVEMIKEILTLKKTIYKNDAPNRCIVFEKKDSADCFVQIGV